MVMIVCPPIDIVNTGSYCIVNMIHATYIWMFILLLLGIFIDYKNKSDFQMGASTLVDQPSVTAIEYDMMFQYLLREAKFSLLFDIPLNLKQT
jgi:hypothetical protein